MNQTIFFSTNLKDNLLDIINVYHSKKIFLVCDTSFQFLGLEDTINSLNLPHVLFNNFQSNPLYEDVAKGVALFNDNHCDLIVAIGGGSCLDVAKCIKLFSHMNPGYNFLLQEFKDTYVPLIALPTTAGTGSESTRFAVIYYQGVKQSIAHDSILPNYAILHPQVLKTLPFQQKKCTLLDAFCQAIESWWSINSTDLSKSYSQKAISLLVENLDDYLLNSESSNGKIMLASNFAGRAINITQTTAAHAMSYKLTSLYGFPHGYACGLCLPKVWRFMSTHMDLCCDPRGPLYLEKTFTHIAQAMNMDSSLKAIEFFETLLLQLEISPPKSIKQTDLDILTNSVNPVRLKNNPISLDQEAIQKIYTNILK